MKPPIDMKISWLDAGREPQCPSNRAYPLGIEVDLSQGSALTCKVSLPYPARRCGAWVVECRICGLRIALTAAGRPDDPHTVKVACKQMARA